MTIDLLPLAHLREWLAGGVLHPSPDASLAARLVTLAELQGVAGQLAQATRTLEGWPAEARERLRLIERVLVVRSVRLLDLAARVHRKLLAHGLRSLPLKGAALAEILYDSPAHRTMGDVDVLALDDWCASARALEAEGFRRLPAADHAAPFVDPETGFTLELHLSAVSCPGLFPLDADGLWKRSLPGSGLVPRLPAPEDLLVQLALHAAFQHGLVLTLGQYLDLSHLVERLPLDSDRLRGLAREAHAEPALAAALRASTIVLGEKLPRLIETLIAECLPPGLGRRLEAHAIRPLTLVPPSTPALGRVRLALVPGRRLAFARRTLLAQPVGTRLSPAAHGLNLLRRARRWAFSVRGAPAPPGSPSA
jgi:hypothetical protein